MAFSGQGAAAGATSGAALGSSILPGWGTAIGAIAGGVFGGFFGPDDEKPPPPPGYISYDDEGNLAGSMTWDGANYVYKAGNLSAKDYNYYEQVKALRDKVLGNLNKTPQENLDRYKEYQARVSEALHTDVDRRFEESSRATEESMNARGMFGSRAYADTMGLRSREKLAADRDIANQAFFGAEQLAAADQERWKSTLGMTESIDAARKNYALAREAATQRGTGLAADTQKLLFQEDLATKEYNQQQQDRWSNMLMDTAGGLAYLYGFKSPGTKTTAPSGGGNFTVSDYFKNNSGRFSLAPTNTSYFGG